MMQNTYDDRSRRIQKIADGKMTTFRYDDWNMIRETTNGEATYSIWGLDLSGTLQGAGGVGGLLAEITPDTVRYPFCDGNGNITDWVDDDGEVIAHYEYDAFGNEMTGESPSSFGFSSKPYDSTLGLYYYGYRFYSPAMGRWLNRDPIEEKGSINLYGFILNSPVNFVDYLGLATDRYGFSVYVGIGPAQGNELISKAAQILRQYKAKYEAPENATQKCRLTIKDCVSSRDLRAATTEYDDVHFYGHGVEHKDRDPKWKRGDPADKLYISRTGLMFSDGDKFLSDVLFLAPGRVKTSYVTAWVCHDKYVDPNNPSGIPVCRPMNNSEANLSAMLLRMITEIILRSKGEGCCTLD